MSTEQTPRTWSHDERCDWCGEPVGAESHACPGPDPEELLKWVESYGHPEVWAQRAKAAHMRAEQAEGKLLRYESMGAVRAVAEPLERRAEQAEATASHLTKALQDARTRIKQLGQRPAQAEMIARSAVAEIDDALHGDDYTKARGVIPWQEGDPLPEEQILQPTDTRNEPPHEH